MATIADIEGIGATQAKKLAEAGVKTVEGLLKAGASATGRKHLSEATGISEKLLLAWVNHADLYRIKGVGSEISDLLEEAGVDSVPELATRNAENLHTKLVETNEKKKLVRVVPGVESIEDFIDQAKKLKKIVTH